MYFNAANVLLAISLGFSVLGCSPSVITKDPHDRIYPLSARSSLISSAVRVLGKALRSRRMVKQ